jgi:hypothetical protein
VRGKEGKKGEPAGKRQFRFNIRPPKRRDEMAASTTHSTTRAEATTSKTSQESKEAKRNAASWDIRRLNAPVTSMNLGTSSVCRPFFLLIFRAFTLAGAIACFCFVAISAIGDIPLRSFLVEATPWVHGGLLIYLTIALWCSILHMIRPSHEPRNGLLWRLSAILYFTIVVMSVGELFRLVLVSTAKALVPSEAQKIFKLGSIHAFERYLVLVLAWAELVLSAFFVAVPCVFFLILS